MRATQSSNDARPRTAHPERPQRPPNSTHSPRNRRRHVRRQVLIACLLCVATLASARAQWVDTTEVPVRDTYGFWEEWLNGFAIIGHVAKFSREHNQDTQPAADSLWAFSQRLGVDIRAIHVHAPDALTRNLVHSTLRRRDTADGHVEGDIDRVLVMLQPWSSPVKRAAFGREISFYAFDSVESPYFIWDYESRSGGAVVPNSKEFDPVFEERRAVEVEFDASTTTANQTVLSGMYYRNPDDSNDHTHFFHSDWLDSRDPVTGGGRTFNFVVQGHLESPLNPSNADSTTIFWLDIWQTIEAGQLYRDTIGGAEIAAAADTAFLIQRIPITKGELTAGLSDTPPIDVNRYRTVSKPVDLRWRADGRLGPLHPQQVYDRYYPNGTQFRTIDVRVRWTGAEAAGLRRIAIRDSIGELVLGTTSASLTYRAAIYRELKTLLRDDTADVASLRTSIIRVETATEPNPTEFAGYSAVNRMMKDTFNWWPLRNRRE